MSKNTGTSELINYFDLGANGDVGIAGSLDVNTIANATTDTDKFLVSDTGIIKYRTGAELLSDIGAAPATGGSYLPLAGGTLTGALNGTTASFTGNIITSAGFFNFANNYGIQARNFQDTAYRTIFKLNTSNQVEIGRSTDISDIILGTASATNALTITSTGSATFSSSVGINGVYSPAAELQVGKSSDVTIAMSNFSSVTSGIRGGIAWYNSSVSTVANIRAVAVTDNVGTELQFYTRPVAGSLTQVLTLASTGAATFSSTVRINADGQSLLIFPTTTNSVRMQIQSTGGGNLVVGTENSTGGNLATGTNAYASVFTSGSTRDLVLGTNSTARLTINGTSGNVLINSNMGIGTGFTPAYPLHVFTSVADWGAVVQNLNASSYGMYVRGGATNGSTSAFFVANTASTTLLDIKGSGAATFSSSVSIPSISGLILGQTAVTDGIISSVSSTVGLNFKIGTTSALYINGSATPDVGIGTTNPAGQLSGTKGLSIVNATNAALGLSNGTNHWLNYLSGTTYRIWNNSVAEVMTLTYGGNVLIGTTTNDGAKLRVEGGEVRVTTSNSGVALYQNSGVGEIAAYNWGGGAYIPLVHVGSEHRFNTSTTERMRITPGGWLKAKGNESTYFSISSPFHELRGNVNNDWVTTISNTSPSPYGLQISYSAIPNSTANQFIWCPDATTLRFEVRSNGGVANFAANDVNLSDERTKKDIEPLESYWDKFKAIEIVKFKYKDQTHDDFNIGVIAQQVESVAPEFVDVDGWNNKIEGNEIVSEEEPLKSIYTSDLHHATIKVLQEAITKIEKLETEINKLKNA